MPEGIPNRSIPAVVRRQVLIEAGHRCAIQTCRSTADVDIHHIVPWAQSHSHEPDNLIALCPNCHRQADRGDIDRTSLRKYKEICQRLHRPPRTHNEPRTFIKFSPRSATILEASNITSFVDAAAMRFGFLFGAPFADTEYVATASGNGSVSFRVLSQSQDGIEIQFDDSCPDIVKIEFSE